MMKNEKLNAFVEYHNAWINEWIENPEHVCESDIYFTNAPKESFITHALPEPYLGDPFNCSAVIININPGGMMGEYQCLKPMNEGNNFITKYVKGNCYHNFAKEFPYLTLDKSKCGTDWWASRNTWINRIVGATPENKLPFAMEICPWHSKSWKGLDYSNEDLINHLKKYVIAPAQEAIKLSELNFVGLSVGTPITQILKKCGYQQKEKWGWNRQTKQFEFSSIWPAGETWQTKRTYTLWNREGSDVFFLNTSAQGGNKAPSEYFKDIEKNILNYIKNNRQELLSK